MTKKKTKTKASTKKKAPKRVATTTAELEAIDKALKDVENGDFSELDLDNLAKDHITASHNEDDEDDEDIDEVMAETVCYWIERGGSDPDAVEPMENLKEFMPKKYCKPPQKTLYRGDKNMEPEDLIGGYEIPTASWTTSKGLAKGWAGHGGVVLQYDPKPDEVIVVIDRFVEDMQKVFPDMDCTIYAEDEVVLMPVKVTPDNVLKD